MALAVDASRPTDTTTLKGATKTTTLTISTSGTNRIVLVYVATETLTTPSVVSAISASGLTFAKRASDTWVSNTGNYQGDMEVWWAYAAAQLTSAVITVTLGTNSDSGVCGAMAVSGVTNFTNPWDPNTSLPAFAKNESASGITAATTGVSTSSVNSMLLEFFASGFNPSQSTGPDTGYTNILSGINSSGAVHDSQFAIEEKVVSAPQASVSVGLSTGATQKWWGNIADALTADLLIPASSRGTIIS